MGVATLLLPPVGGTALIASLPWITPHLTKNAVAPVACGAFFTLLAGLAILPTAVLSVFAGYAFGFAHGLPVAMAGYTGATLVAYFLSGRIAGGRVTTLIEEYPRWHAVHAALLGGAFGKVFTVVTLLRLGPVPPFAMTNYALGATRVSLPPLVLGTVLGIIPRTAAMVSLAAGVKEFNAEGLHSAEAPWLVALGVVGTLVCMVVLTWWAKRALDRVTGPQRGLEPGPTAPIAEREVEPQ